MTMPHDKDPFPVADPTKEEVKKLWKLCFDDSDEFVEMYFRLRYNDETALHIRREGAIVSALQMPCYPMTFEGTEIQTAYISGACTRPGFRGKGIMARLLAESFGRIAEKNIPLSILIPANPGLYDYYAKAGYAPAFFRSQIEQHITGVDVAENNLRVEHTTAFDRRLFDYFTREARHRPNYVQHTAVDFEAVMEDLRISKGSVAMAIRQDSQEQIAGAVFAYPNDGYLKIAEWFADNDNIRDSLFREAARHHGFSTVIRFGMPVRSAGEEPFGMARVIHAPMMLKLYAAAHPDKKVCIHLTDKQLPFNNGYYHIDSGSCAFSSEAPENECLELDARELNALLFDQVRLYMSLMLE